MYKKMCLVSLAFATCFVLCPVAHADVYVTSPNFIFSGNWPTNQPVAAGSYVPSSPTNIAASAVGATPFANGEHSHISHKIAHLNDSRYGNSYSWITTGGSLSRSVNLGRGYGIVDMSFAGVAFSNATLHSISAIVFGRNADNQYKDRRKGNIYIQVTTASSVAAITDLSAAADAQWTTLGFFTTNDSYEHMFTFSSPVNATGVRIVTTAGNCIDEIVVHEAPPTEMVYESPAFIWTNSAGAAWSEGANWTNGVAPNSVLANVYMVEAPDSSKTIDVDTSYSLLDGIGNRFGTLTIDSSTGDGSPLTFTGDAFYLWLSDIDVTGTLILSNAVDSYAGIRITGGGETILTEWTPNRVTQSKITIDEGSQLTVEGTISTAKNTLPPGPWMHLDASRTNTMNLIDAGGGSFYVQQWNDVNGNGTYAYAEDAVNRPLWSLENGRANIDFGFLTSGNIGGIMNGQTLTWSAPSTGIRAVFLVYSDKPDDPSVQNIIGTKSVTSALHFRRAGVLFHSDLASPFITGGTITLDGLLIDGTDKGGEFNAYLSSGFHVIGITTTGDVSADCFARDHLGHAGGQKLAEVLIYNHALTPIEHKSVVAHLMNKWFSNPLPTDSSAGAG